jgi:hypothetical protein
MHACPVFFCMSLRFASPIGVKAHTTAVRWQIYQIPDARRVKGDTTPVETSATALLSQAFDAHVASRLEDIAARGSIRSAPALPAPPPPPAVAASTRPSLLAGGAPMLMDNKALFGSPGQAALIAASHFTRGELHQLYGPGDFFVSWLFIFIHVTLRQFYRAGRSLS